MAFSRPSGLGGRSLLPPCWKRSLSVLTVSLLALFFSARGVAIAVAFNTEPTEIRDSSRTRAKARVVDPKQELLAARKSSQLRSLRKSGALSVGYPSYRPPPLILGVGF